MEKMKYKAGDIIHTTEQHSGIIGVDEHDCVVFDRIPWGEYIIIVPELYGETQFTISEDWIVENR